MLDKDKCDWELTSSFWNFECRISCKLSQGEQFSTSLCMYDATENAIP